MKRHGYKIGLLQKCEYYNPNFANISDGLINLIGQSQLLILFLSRNFLDEDLKKRTQLSTCIQLYPDGNKIFIILVRKNKNTKSSLSFNFQSNEMSEEDLNKIPDNLGKISLRHGSPRLNDPYLWDIMSNYLPPLRESQQNESFYEQIPSPAQSAFV